MTPLVQVTGDPCRMRSTGSCASNQPDGLPKSTSLRYMSEQTGCTRMSSSGETHPQTLFKGSIATPSLEAAIINSKYVNSMPLDRISRDFEANGLHLSRQTMSNWTVWSAERYFTPVYEYMKARQLRAHVNQCDETTVEVIHDGRPAGSKSYMWVHLTGELSPDPRIIVYEYQKTRHSDHPKEYYKGL